MPYNTSTTDAGSFHPLELPYNILTFRLQFRGDTPFPFKLVDSNLNFKFLFWVGESDSSGKRVYTVMIVMPERREVYPSEIDERIREYLQKIGTHGTFFLQHPDDYTVQGTDELEPDGPCYRHAACVFYQMRNGNTRNKGIRMRRNRNDLGYYNFDDCETIDEYFRSPESPLLKTKVFPKVFPEEWFEENSLEQLFQPTTGLAKPFSWLFFDKARILSRMEAIAGDYAKYELPLGVVDSTPQSQGVVHLFRYWSAPEPWIPSEIAESSHAMFFAQVFDQSMDSRLRHCLLVTFRPVPSAQIRNIINDYNGSTKPAMSMTLKVKNGDPSDCGVYSFGRGNWSLNPDVQEMLRLCQARPFDTQTWCSSSYDVCEMRGVSLKDTVKFCLGDICLDEWQSEHVLHVRCSVPLISDVRECVQELQEMVQELDTLRNAIPESARAKRLREEIEEANKQIAQMVELKAKGEEKLAKYKK